MYVLASSEPGLVPGDLRTLGWRAVVRPGVFSVLRLLQTSAVLASMAMLAACSQARSQSDKEVSEYASISVSSQEVSVDAGSPEMVDGREVPVIVGAVPDRQELMKPAPNTAWNNFIWQGNNTYEIAPGTFVFRYRYTQSLFLVSDEGVIVTDPISPAAAEVYRDAIRAVTDKPVTHVVYSHDHWDHALGGQVFKDEGATFIAHENCLESWRRIPNPDLVIPDETVAGNHRIQLGGQTLDLLYFGLNHGACMLVMRPNESEYLFLVDLVTPGNMPNNWMPDYNPVEWIRTLKEIEAIEGWSTIIPAHGPIVAHRSALTERRRYLELLLQRAFESYEKGGSLNAMVERIKMPEYSHLRGYDSNLSGNAERAIAVPYMGY